MATVTFTNNIQRHLDCPSVSADGATVRDVLDAVFQQHPTARGYVLDDRNRVRKHMNVFVNGRLVVDRADLSDAVPADASIYVMQALSGG